MIIDEKLVNTIRLISLKNALDFNNNIKLDVVISKTFSYSKDSKHSIKDLIPEIKKIISELSLLSLNEKKNLYDQIIGTSNHYLNDPDHCITNLGFKDDNKNQMHEKKSIDNQSFELPPLVDAVYGNVITRFPP